MLLFTCPGLLRLVTGQWNMKSGYHAHAFRKMAPASLLPSESLVSESHQQNLCYIDNMPQGPLGIVFRAGLDTEPADSMQHSNFRRGVAFQAWQGRQSALFLDSSSHVRHQALHAHLTQPSPSAPCSLTVHYILTQLLKRGGSWGHKGPTLGSPNCSLCFLGNPQL